MPNKGALTYNRLAMLVVKLRKKAERERMRRKRFVWRMQALQLELGKARKRCLELERVTVILTNENEALRGEQDRGRSPDAAHLGSWRYTAPRAEILTCPVSPGPQMRAAVEYARDHDLRDPVVQQTLRVKLGWDKAETVDPMVHEAFQTVRQAWGKWGQMAGKFGGGVDPAMWTEPQ